MFFADKSQLYSTKKLDFKDEIINRSTFHSQYLFSDCALTARNYLIVFAERFMSKLSIPENEPAKKVVKKISNTTLNFGKRNLNELTYVLFLNLAK